MQASRQVIKEYRLLAWPRVPGNLARVGHRRMLSDLSHRYMTIPQLMATSGMSRRKVRVMLDALDRRGLLAERDHETPNFLLDDAARERAQQAPAGWRRFWHALRGRSHG
jgi:hypothetical protein